MKKLFILLIGLFIGASISFSQIGFGFESGFRTAMGHSKTFKQFARSYNSHFADDIDKELSSSFSFPYGWALSTDFSISGFYGALRFHEVQGHNKVKFKSGAARTFKREQFMYSVLAGFGTQDSDFAFNASVGLAFGTDRIISMYQYADGTKSIGREKFLNGVYDAGHYAYIASVGGAVTIAEPFCVYMRAEYILGTFVGLKGPLDDSHWNRSLEVLSNYPTGIPTDVEKWEELQGEIGAYSSEDFVHADWKGFRLEIGIRFQIN
ncbi:MAG: hypothetical protein EP338_10185 [Bacteroidetes bacterium]|nr:MAG: hypothetical protein EP338_10185 [Bacteroidota bacterium]